MELTQYINQTGKKKINVKGVIEFENEVKERFAEFLELNRKKLIKEIKRNNCYIDISELREQDNELYEAISLYPENCIEAIEDIIKDKLINYFEITKQLDDKINPMTDVEVGYRIHAMFYNYPESDEKYIRDIRSVDINKLICTEALIRQVSGVKSIADVINYSCPSCGSTHKVKQYGDTVVTPSRCSCGAKSFEKIGAVVSDVQLMYIEEKHEDTDNNHQPESIKIILRNGLTDKSHTIFHIPGTVVKIIGTVKEETKYVRGSNVSRMTEKFIDVNNIIYIEDTFSKIELSQEDVDEIKEIANMDNTLEVFSKSMAPAVIGYESIKKCLSLQVMGGVRSKRTDGSFTRENIHGLIVGDAGLSKSVMLKFVSNLMPRGRYSSGRGASSVGLTAAVTKSDLTNEYALVGGALIMANGSVLSVDEAEKMKDEDITNLHEAMSIGTVTIDKATIHAVLPARTSVLMAANPKYGRFRRDTEVYNQISFPPSLISRFDFIFAIKDIPNEVTDSLIADKILSEHMETAEQQAIPVDLLKKYIYYARHIDPKLTPEANKVISAFYISLRKQSKESGDGRLLIPITPRQLESLVRLSEAHARLKLHEKVLAEDALQAVNIFKEYLAEFGYDEENNAFNIDKLMGTVSKMTIMDLIIKKMKEIENDYPDKSVPYEVVEKAFFPDGIDGKEYKKFEDAWFNLNKGGDILKIGAGYKLNGRY